MDTSKLRYNLLLMVNCSDVTVEDIVLRNTPTWNVVTVGCDNVHIDGIKEIVPELKRQGANLNQLVKKLNERGFIDYKKELPETLGEVRAVWQLLRQYLQKLE